MFLGVQIPPQGVWKPRVTNLRKYNWWMAHGSVTSTIIFVLQDWVILNQDDVMFRYWSNVMSHPEIDPSFRWKNIGLGKFHGKMGDLALYFIVHWDVWRLAKQAAIWLERPRLLWPQLAQGLPPSNWGWCERERRGGYATGVWIRAAQCGSIQFFCLMSRCCLPMCRRLVAAHVTHDHLVL